MNNPVNMNGFMGGIAQMASSAQFYTSSPRPYAKTSLGFYSDAQPYEDISDNDGEDEEMSADTPETDSGASTPPTFDNNQDVDIADPQQQQAQPQPLNSGFKPPMPVPPMGFLPNFAAMAGTHFQQPLDQHTLQQLMVNPELLRQLNEASSRLLASKTASVQMPQPPMCPPQQPQQQQQQHQQQPPFNGPFVPPNQMPPPPPPPAHSFFPAFPASSFPTPIQTPSTTPVCGAPVRPMISGIFSQPIGNQCRMMPPPAPMHHWQQNNGLLQMATPNPSSEHYGSSPPSFPHHHQQQPQQQQNANPHKICLVCGDTKASLHYGRMTCFACMDFFRRRVVSAVTKPGRSERRYSECYNKTGRCVVTKDTRNDCKYCRFQRCLEIGMRVDSVRTALENRRCQSALPPMM